MIFSLQISPFINRVMDTWREKKAVLVNTNGPSSRIAIDELQTVPYGLFYWFEPMIRGD